MLLPLPQDSSVNAFSARWYLLNSQATITIWVPNNHGVRLDVRLDLTL